LSSDYEGQQEELKASTGLGEETEEDFSSLDFRVPEVSDSVYRDVEPMLFRGFLTVGAEINGVPFVFKSLNHHEFTRLNMIFGSSRSDRFYNAFLAQGLLYIDGHSVLLDPSIFSDNMKFFEVLPLAVKRKVVLHMSELNRRASKATVLTEAYCFEGKSRIRWSQLRGLDLTSTAVTGFQGTETLGMNWAQLFWRSMNYFEDLKEKAEREWENAKFIASSMAGKGISKIYSADKRRRKSEFDERMDRRDRVIRHAVFREPLDGPREAGTVLVAKTVADLASQLDRDLRGEKDWHDQVIADYEAQARSRLHEHSERIEAVRSESAKSFGDRSVLSSVDATGFTLEEVEARRKAEWEARVTESLATPKEGPDYSDERNLEMASKWLGTSVPGK
jgi:hypothetical protein